MLAAKYRGFKSDPFDQGELPPQKSPRSMSYEEVRKEALKRKGKPDSPKRPVGAQKPLQMKRKKKDGS